MPENELRRFIPGATVVDKGLIGVIDVRSEVEDGLERQVGKVSSQCPMDGSTVVIGLSHYI